MIIDNLSTSMTDYGVHGPLFVKAFDWLKSTDLQDLEPGQVVEIDGKRVMAQIHRYTTVDVKDLFFESHRSYIDIQYLVSGEELIQWAPLGMLTKSSTPYDYLKDIAWYEDPSSCISLLLSPGDFAVFFPSDGHKPKGLVTTPQVVKKIVIKVSVQ